MMSALKGKTENIYQMSQNDNAVLTTKVASHIAYGKSSCKFILKDRNQIIIFISLKVK